MNGILLVDKPEDWTSHDVVAKLRGILKERRIGHSGTLDPMATGLLVVFVGRATRAVEFAESDKKSYTAGLRLGTVTDTMDTTGNIHSDKDCSVPIEELNAALHGFRGNIEQIPPMYSAIKIGGKKLYELARRGQEIERKPRNVTIYELEAKGSGRDYTLKICCSKGTYIRSLCNDIGESLGCGGCMSSLRRTKAGIFSVENALSLTEIENAENREALLMPVDSLFSDRPECVINSDMEKKCRNGNYFAVDVSDGEYRVYSESGEFLMLGEVKNKTAKVIKSFFEV